MSSGSAAAVTPDFEVEPPDVSHVVTEDDGPYDLDVEPPDVSAVVTEDDTPVDNFPSEKQQRLFTEPLYSSWSGPPPDEDGLPRPFLAAANIGVFATPKAPPVVPDALLALDVVLDQDWWKKEHRSYFIWEIGKTPDVVIEIVSNRQGNELGSKLRRYAWMRIPYYVVWDPSGCLGGPALRAFELHGLQYVPMDRAWFANVNLGLTQWDGSYEGHRDIWLRWCDAEGTLVPTGAERAEAERERAEAEHTRAERLAARLRAMGIDPDHD